MIRHIAALFCWWVLVAAASDGESDPAIGVWIAKHAKKLHGVESASARYAVRGDIDGDGRSDAAVLYTIRGSGKDKFQLRYLAAFRRGRGTLEYRAHVLVGGSGIREVNRATIFQRMIEIEALEYRSGDAACCPTSPVKRRYQLSGRRLARMMPGGGNDPEKEYGNMGRR